MNRVGKGLIGLMVPVLVAALAGCGGGSSSGSSASGGAAPSSGSSSAASQPKELKKISLRLNWAIGGYHAMYFVAKDKGYFKDEGLDVEIQAGKGSVDTVTLVANNSAQIGLADAVSIIPGKIKGMPIKAIGVTYQKNPTSIISLSEKNIKTLKDMEGKTFGAVPTASPYILYKGLLKANNIDTSKIKEVTVDSPGIAQLLTKQVDAITLFYTETYPVEVQAKQKLNVIKLDDNGIDIYGLALVTNETTLKDPALIKGFLRAVQKGIADAKANPDAAIDMLIQDNPALKETRDQQLQLLKDAFTVMPGNLDMDAGKWDRTQKILFDQKSIDKTLDPNQYFDSSFLK